MKNKEDFAIIRFNYGLVVRGNVESIKHLKGILAASMEKLEIEPIFQIISPARLVIEEHVGGEAK